MGRLCKKLIVLAMALFCTSVIAQDDQGAWYDAESLNEGLGPRPESINLTTPRAAMRAFVENGRQDRFGAAAHVLNLNQIEDSQQAKRAEQIAQQLYQVLDRRVWVDWSDLPSRPDAKVEQTAGNSNTPGEVRRDLGIKLFEFDGRAYEIRIARYKAGENQEAVWLFTPQTVADVPALHDAYGPRAFERVIPREMKKQLGGLRIWEWVALPVMFGLLIAIGWLVNTVVTALSRKAPYAFLQHAFSRAGFPLALFAVAVVAQLVLSLAVSFSGPVTSIVQPMLVIVMASGVGVAALRIVDALLDRITQRYVGDIDDTRSLDKRELYTSIYALRRIIVLLMVGFAALYVLARLNLFDSIGMTLLASAGVLTVLLGIAGQAVLGNIMASLQIALAKPVRIGDSVLFEGDWAYVESIFYTFMRLRTWDERRIIVPVRHFVSKPFENWSVTDARILRAIPLVLDHRADTDILRDKFIELAKADDGVIDHENLSCYVTSHSDRGQEVTCYAMAPDPSTGWKAEMRLREGLLSYIRENHPDWWPRERITGSDESRAAAVSG
ncbi:mechanosensitive ion channel domain-containing protein [uncultured Roseovarius sp.]|uniref:mechanosensitive ion channel family protein n=1 Tax=uncultured Roseovarius sp. TaxID=293344 RepID=UPI0025FB50B9|nr:mechanosensitive ion channel domain-containing protein [uncultured Roseovarius sp.]